MRAALKYALRQDPDVVLIGEMRDQETIGAGLTIAETGHLAFATLHTNSCAETINRVIDVFPSNQQSQIRAQLAFVLEGVVTQTLLPKAKGSGRVAACEIMVCTPAIRACIRDDKMHQIYSIMQAGKKFGMQTMNDASVPALHSGQYYARDGVAVLQRSERAAAHVRSAVTERVTTCRLTRRIRGARSMTATQEVEEN